MDCFAALPVVVLQQILAMVDGQYVTTVVPSSPTLPLKLFAVLRTVSRDWRRLIDGLVDAHHAAMVHVRLTGDVATFPQQLDAIVKLLHQRCSKNGTRLRAMTIRIGTDEFVRSFEILKARAYDEALDGVAVDWTPLFAACPELQRLDLSGIPLHSRHLGEILDVASVQCPDLLALELPRKEWHRGQVSMAWRPTFHALLRALERWHLSGSKRGLVQLTIPQRITKCDALTTMHDLTDQYLYALAAFCPNLQHLDGWKVTYAESEGRLCCEELLFSSRDAWAAFCRSCTQLHELNWFVLPFIDNFFEAFAETPKPNLKKLVLAGGDHVNFGQDAVFGTYYSDGSWSYSSEGLTKLFRGCPALEELDVVFQFTPFDDAGRHDVIDDDFLIALATHCPKLKRLEIKELNNASFYGSLKGISDRGIASLAALRELRVVSLKDTKCEGQGLLELIKHAPREGPPRVVDMIVGGFELAQRERRQDTGNFYSIVSDVLLAVYQHPQRFAGRRFQITLKGVLRDQPFDRQRQLWKGSTMMLTDALLVSCPWLQVVVDERFRHVTVVLTTEPLGSSVPRPLKAARQSRTPCCHRCDGVPPWWIAATAPLLGWGIWTILRSTTW
ncbi:hypothetical protein PINS_up021302 [Pythium insidiosum]|nr:hypothetical protein PINS_up021302 [Pythium insidiosum]